MKLKDVVNSILSNKETKVSDEEIIDTIKLLASEATIQSIQILRSCLKP